MQTDEQTDEQIDPMAMLAAFSGAAGRGGGCGETVVYADVLDSGISDGWDCVRHDPTGLVAACDSGGLRGLSMRTLAGYDSICCDALVDCVG